jgi:hypothetical protein
MVHLTYATKWLYNTIVAERAEEVKRSGVIDRKKAKRSSSWEALGRGRCAVLAQRE